MPNRAGDWLAQAVRDLEQAAAWPFEHYGPLQSEQALVYAREIVDFVRPQMA